MKGKKGIGIGIKINLKANRILLFHTHLINLVNLPIAYLQYELRKYETSTLLFLLPFLAIYQEICVG